MHGDDGDDIITPPAIVVFPWARYNYHIIWQIIVHRYRNKNHTFCEKISSHNYIATSSIGVLIFQPLISLDVGLEWYHHHWPQWCHYGYTMTQIQHKAAPP